VYVSVTTFTCVAALFDFAKTLPASLRASLHLEGAISLAGKVLPFFKLNLGWIAPAVIGLILGLLIRKLRKGQAK